MATALPYLYLGNIASHNNSSSLYSPNQSSRIESSTLLSGRQGEVIIMQHLQHVGTYVLGLQLHTNYWLVYSTHTVYSIPYLHIPYIHAQYSDHIQLECIPLQYTILQWTQFPATTYTSSVSFSKDSRERLLLVLWAKFMPKMDDLSSSLLELSSISSRWFRKL